LGSTTLNVRLAAENDSDASWEAMDVVLSKAHADPSGPWALGEIVVRYSAEERIVRVMPARGVSAL
jgi:hypothetical protein